MALSTAALALAGVVAVVGAVHLWLYFYDNIQSILHLLTQFTQLPYEVEIIINVHFTIVPITFGISSVSDLVVLVPAASH